MVHRGFALPAVLTLLAALTPLSARAVLIEIDSEQWDVEAIGTSAFLDEGVEDLLKAQPWWGDSALAYAFADAVRGELGIGLYVFSDDPTWRGPMFAYAMSPPENIYWIIEGWSPSFSDPISKEFTGVTSGHTLYGNSWFAFATPVPEPATLSLLAAGLLGALATRRRSRDTKSS